jgi:hypothetical protein
LTTVIVARSTTETAPVIAEPLTGSATIGVPADQICYQWLECEFPTSNPPTTSSARWRGCGTLSAGLRDATAEKLNLAQRWAHVHRTTGDPTLKKRAFKAMRYYASHQEEQPFTHPYYWAAFTLSGA